MKNILGYYLMPHPPLIIPSIGKGEEEKIQSTIIIVLVQIVCKLW